MCPPQVLVTIIPAVVTAGTGPDGLQELERHAGCGVSLSLVHLPPGVRLRMYHRKKGTTNLQPGASAYSGEPKPTDVRVVARTC